MTAGFRWTSCGRKKYSEILCRNRLCCVAARRTNLSVTGDGDHAEGNFDNAERQRATAAGRRVHETGDRARKARRGEQSQALEPRERTRPLHLIHGGASLHSALLFPTGPTPTRTPCLSAASLVAVEVPALVLSRLEDDHLVPAGDVRDGRVRGARAGADRPAVLVDPLRM